MPRSVPEWRSDTPNATIPPRVRLRVFERSGGRCEGCSRKLNAGDRWDCDHIVAIINGGEHKESNLRCLCSWCHKAKTAEDVAEKSMVYRKRLKVTGAREKRPWNTKWKKKMDGTVVPR